MRDDGMGGRESSASIWVFGYGSLIWNPDFPYVEKRTGTVQGWARRFWQGSPDHRGVPDAPGRVVTLVRDPAARCWGVAYALASASAEQTLAALDVREAGGYSQLRLDVACDDGTTVRGALTFVATDANPWYLGPASVAEIAAQAARSRGPSGDNREYVLRLAEALRRHGADDPHVFAIAEQLSSLLSSRHGFDA